jgi:hypothetical protein
MLLLIYPDLSLVYAHTNLGFFLAEDLNRFFHAPLWMSFEYAKPNDYFQL